MTDEEKHYGQELGKISMWMDEFAINPDDSIYLCFLRLLAAYRHLQAQEMDEAIEREEKRIK